MDNSTNSIEEDELYNKQYMNRKDSNILKKKTFDENKYSNQNNVINKTNYDNGYNNGSTKKFHMDDNSSNNNHNKKNNSMLNNNSNNNIPSIDQPPSDIIHNNHHNNNNNKTSSNNYNNNHNSNDNNMSDNYYNSYQKNITSDFPKNSNSYNNYDNVEKELYTSFNFDLKNLNYEDIEDSVISKSNRLYLFNKFFTSLFYEDNTRTHNFIMFNIYNIEQKRQTHKVSLFLEKDYSNIFPYAYNNLLFYAFDCYKFYRHIKSKFQDTYKIYENSTSCLYINNNYETNLIKRLFMEENNYNHCKYYLNEKRILKTCTKYFMDNFLSLIDKKINIKNIIPYMKKNNYEFDQRNLYFFISNFNLMDKIFSDSHGFDCNKKFFEQNCPNIKNYAIFFKYIKDASHFYDTHN